MTDISIQDNKPVAKSIDRLKNVLDNQNTNGNDRIQQYISSVGKIVKIPVSDIHLNENVRCQIDTDDSNFQSLLASIKKHGIQQNIVVELRIIDDDYKIVCISGHRRVMAAKMCGTIPLVPALIKQFSDTNTRTELALIENLLREDLHCLDVANGYKSLFDNGWSREKLSKTFGKTDRTIHTYLKIAEWSNEAKQLIVKNSKILNAKLLTRKIACRKFENEKELIKSLKSHITPKTSTVKNHRSRKTILSEKLTSFLNQKNFKPEINDAINATFKALDLI
jgi:ParB/RepB/Spo0J family partition protein